MNETELTDALRGIEKVCEIAEYEANEGNLDFALKLLSGEETRCIQRPGLGKEILLYVKQCKGTILSDNGHYEEALQAFEETLEIAESLASGKLIGRAHYNLGLVYRRMMKLEIAEQEYLKALTIFSEIRENDSDLLSRTADVLNNLGYLYKLMNKNDEALNYFIKAQDAFKQLAQEDEDLLLNVAYGYDNLASSYYCIGDTSKAIENYGNAVELYKLIIANDGPDCSHDLRNSQNAIQKIKDKMAK